LEAGIWILRVIEFGDLSRSQFSAILQFAELTVTIDE
jgi:hypothetical protein